tara:strand:+ start:9682 stop:9972 length:291 start_codon:yes stop_codon:yes gene_type:complete
MDGGFEWDAAKAAGNLTKHRISFEQGSRIFRSQALDWLNIEVIDGELRYIAIGEVDLRCLVVVYTLRGDDAIRIISARRATRREQDNYYRTNYSDG